MPKADATGLAPKNRLDPSAAHRSGGNAVERLTASSRASLSLASCAAVVFLWLHSLVEPPSGGLGLKNAKDRRAVFARRSELSFGLISRAGPEFACDRCARPATA